MKQILMGCMLLMSMEIAAQTVTEVLYPQYVQGVGSSNASDDRKVPFACRMTVSGLTASTTYRYYHRFVADPTLATNGQGYYIIANPTGDFVRVTSASLAVAGRYGEFTTSASGSYTGWFIVEPSLALEFQPGTQLYFRIMLNDGAGGGSVQQRLTATNPVTVLGWGSAPGQGTGLRAVPNPAAIPKNFMMLYDNEAGTGRPITGTFIENDGTDNNASTNGYAPFYASNVDAQQNAWGTIIPNNLSTGIRRIAQYSLLNGNAVGAVTTTNGVYPTIPAGTINTSNANGGLSELIIAAAPLPVKLVNFSAVLQSDRSVKLNWRSQSELNFSKYQVERSIDGRSYETIATVNGKGDNSDYAAVDILPGNLAYYQLRMIDLDGSFSLSEVRVVKATDEFKITVSPNPVSSRLNVQFSSFSNPISIIITSASGATVYSSKLQAGLSSAQIDVSSWQQGVYVLTLQTGTIRKSVRFHKN